MGRLGTMTLPLPPSTGDAMCDGGDRRLLKAPWPPPLFCRRSVVTPCSEAAKVRPPPPLPAAAPGGPSLLACLIESEYACCRAIICWSRCCWAETAPPPELEPVAVAPPEASVSDILCLCAGFQIQCGWADSRRSAFLSSLSLHSLLLATRSRALARGGCFIHYWAGGRHSSMAITKMADDEMMSDEAEGRDDRLISSYWASRRVDL